MRVNAHRKLATLNSPDWRVNSEEEIATRTGDGCTGICKLGRRTEQEKTLCALGPAAEVFFKGAAARGATTLPFELDTLVILLSAYGRELFIPALGRCERSSKENLRL